MRTVPFGIGENVPHSTLVFSIVDAITPYGVIASLIFVWHGLWGLCPAIAPELQRGMCVEPIDVLFTTVGLMIAEPVLKLFTEGHAEFTEPQIMLEAFTCPYGAWVPGVPNREVATLTSRLFQEWGRLKRWCSSGSCSKNPVRCVEQLGGFQYHFYNVFVAVPSCAPRGLFREIEDVHFAGGLDWGSISWSHGGFSILSREPTRRKPQREPKRRKPCCLKEPT